MKNTDTPEADNHEAGRDQMDTRGHADYVATLDLCRKLERERNEARSLAETFRYKYLSLANQGKTFDQMIPRKAFSWENA